MRYKRFEVFIKRNGITHWNRIINMVEFETKNSWIFVKSISKHFTFNNSPKVQILLANKFSYDWLKSHLRERPKIPLYENIITFVEKNFQ